jgi:Arc/MetJ family transcription regulator
MALTSVDIDSDMLQAAKATYGVKTNREAINLALRDVVMRRRQLDAIDALAEIAVDERPEKIAYGA